MTSTRPPTSRTDKLQRLFELAAGQAGYFTAVQARELGYSARSLVHHVSAGHVERVSRGFYRLVGVPASSHEDVVAAWLRFASRGGVVSHDTARRAVRIGSVSLARDPPHTASRPPAAHPTSDSRRHVAHDNGAAATRGGHKPLRRPRHVSRSDHRRCRRHRRRSQRGCRGNISRPRYRSRISERTAHGCEASLGACSTACRTSH